MELFKKISKRKEKISVIGLGYVGLPIAIELAKKYDVVGFDINKDKVEKYCKGIDVTNEVGNEEVFKTEMIFTTDEEMIKTCKFHIIAVPTPINNDKTPNLNPVIGASQIVGRNLTKGSIVVYESTVYPGTTEEICIPILEKESSLKLGAGFKVGYSPERINPGDKVNTLTKITKVVSGSDELALEEISKLYDSVIKAGIYKAESIKIAEASKIIENSQRDINIAFMNELSMVFNKMDIDTKAVLEAAGTKWNFLNFTPGLVGGHCIGVDPHYFIYKAEQLGYHSQIILSGRKINESMAKHVATNTVKQIIKSGQVVKGAKVGILGITFKENCADVRNTKVIDIIKELIEYGIEVSVHDPVANAEDVYSEFKIELVEENKLSELDCVIITVSHDYYRKQNLNYYKKMYKKDNPKPIIDVKSILKKKESIAYGFKYWSL